MNLSSVCALFGAAGVALGAFGAHGLKKRVQDERRLNAWKTGAEYHLIHAVAAYAAASAGKTRAAQLFLGGITLFSGSLYAFAGSGVMLFAYTAPLGGLTLIGAWVVLALF